jgi:putative ABC transport system permease protein
MNLADRLGELGQDLRFSGRQLWKNPGFTLVAVLTLALGIGATTAIFSVVYGVVLRALPFAAPERLVRPFSVSAQGVAQPLFSAANFLDWRAASRTIAAAAAVQGTTLNLSGEQAEPERLRGARVSAGFFQVLGVRPLTGRTFQEGEDRPGNAGVAVISEDFWRRRYGGDRGVIGRSLTLNGEPHTVVGILARGTQLPTGVDVWVPLVVSPAQRSRRGAASFGGVARLAPGATLEQARAEAELIGRRLAAQYPDANAGFADSMTVEPLQEQLVGETRKPLLILLGAVGFVLLIACANVANLLLVRAAARESEIVIRAALGAGRARIVRQLLTESLLLAAAGGAAGMALAAWITRVLVTLAPRGIPRLQDIGLDGAALLFALGTSVLTGMLFGLAPALQASRTDLSGAIREGTRGSRGRGGTRARSTLVVAETALAVVLLAGAGLLIRSFSRLQEVNPGFETRHALTFNLELPPGKYPDEARLRAFMAALLERMGRLPGVNAVGATTYGMPFQGNLNEITFSVVGRPPAPPGKEDVMRVAVATPDYFRALGLQIVRGRGFTAQDRDGAPQAVILNQTAARRFFPAEEALGKRLVLATKVPRNGEVVGVVSDFKQDALAKEIEPQVFLAYDQVPKESLSVVLRSDREPQILAGAARAQMRELDPDLPVFGLQPVAELVAGSTAQSRFYMLLLGGFAAISLALAAVGIYGVIAYAVRQRTQEIGIRMALGASRGKVLRMVVGQGLTLALAGAAAGLAGAFAAARGLRGLLFEVSASDPLTYLGVALMLVLVAAIASYLPARRAARTEPNLALRGEA